jgi:hypothetical protein
MFQTKVVDLNEIYRPTVSYMLVLWYNESFLEKDVKFLL